MMEKTIKRACKVVSYENLDICRGLLNFDSFFSYFDGVKLYNIRWLNCHPYLLRKINMQDTGHEHNTRFSASEVIQSIFVNLSINSESLCIIKWMYLFVIQ